MKKKVLIFGSSSFLGYNFNKLLNKDFKIFSVFRSKKYLSIKKKRFNKVKSKKIYFNIQKDNFKNLNIDPEIIINCLGDTKNFQKQFKSGNSKSIFRNFLKLIINYKNKLIIHSGSGAEYSKNSKYGSYKLFETKSLLKHKNNLIVILRIFSIFGELNKKDSLIEIIKKKSEHKISNMEKKFKLISINDLILIVKFIIKNRKKIKKNFIIDCCYSTSVSPKDILERKITKKHQLNNKDIFFSKNIKNSIKVFLNHDKNIVLKKINNYISIK